MNARMHSILFASVTLVAAPSLAGAQQFDQTTAKVAAWNLGGYDPIPARRLRKQVDGLAMLDAEVVALVEINPPEALETFREDLAKKGACYDKRILPQTGATNQHIGVLFKCGVDAGTPEFIPGSNLGNPGLRQAVTINMTIGKFDFILIIVHFKSARGAEEQATRDRQAKVIADFIRTKLAEKREDILLVGDFNMIPGQDVSNFHHLGGDDVMDFLSSWDLQARFSHLLPTGRANLLDGFAITRTHTNEYMRGSLRVFPMHWTMDRGREWFRDNVSDHLPFVASFRIDKDRD